MNIDKVYVCDIYMLKDRVKKKYYTKVYMENDFNDYLDDYVVNKCVFVKKALVYFSVLLGYFVDLETGEFYNIGYPKNKGELFVDINKSKIYGKELMGAKKKHYTKKRILKRYIEYKDGDNNECK